MQPAVTSREDTTRAVVGRDTTCFRVYLVLLLLSGQPQAGAGAWWEGIAWHARGPGFDYWHGKRINRKGENGYHGSAVSVDQSLCVYVVLRSEPRNSTHAR